MARTILDFIVFVMVVFCLCWLHYLTEDIQRLNAVTFESVRCDKNYDQNES